MKKTDLINYGIPEEKVSSFQKIYWEDVKKQVRVMVEDARGQDSAPSPSAMREAIESMLRLIPDPVRLSSILSNVNRHYQNYQNEQNGLNNASKQPENSRKGASECQ